MTNVEMFVERDLPLNDGQAGKCPLPFLRKYDSFGVAHWVKRKPDRVRIQFPGCQASISSIKKKFTFFRYFLFRE